MDDLLPRELWILCLAYIDGKYTSKQSSAYFSSQAEMNILLLRTTCVLFSTLCLELITHIEICERKEGDEHFTMPVLVNILLDRPSWLKSIVVKGKILDGTTPALVALLFEKLARQAPVLEEIELILEDVVLPGSLLRGVGESCLKLKALTLHVDLIEGPFDSPAAFGKLELLDLVAIGMKRMTAAQRNAVAAPDFSHFTSLTHVNNLLDCASFALSLAKAPCLQSISTSADIKSIIATNEDIRAFCKACKNMPIRSSLVSLSQRNTLYNLDTLIAILDTFPLLEHLEVDHADLDLDATFLNKLGTMTKLTFLSFYNCRRWQGPTRAWLADSCSRFPVSLSTIKLKYWRWNNMDEADSRSKSKYIAFIKASFKACLPNLVEMEFSGM